MTTYVVRPRLPMRAFVLAALLSMVGAVGITLVAATEAAQLWMWASSVLLLLGVLLLLTALTSLRRLRTYVELGDDGWEVRAPGGTRRGLWRDVSKVTIAANGVRLTLHHADGRRTHIVAPAPTDEMQAMAVDIAARLDASRGYHN
ncbi:MAG: hypothetical protein M0Z51_17240 [Propionibacterium sp.]|nr:hypothetical protein [Propionibacterium sp.]